MQKIRHLAIILAALIPVPAFAQWVACADNSVTCTTQNVGIGTTSPTNKLHVMDTTDALTFFVVENTSSTGTSAAAVLRAKSNTAQVNFQAHGSARTISRFGLTLGGWNEFLAVNGNGLIIGTNAGAGPLVLGTASTARITVLADGNTGIGTATPSSKLDVAGSIHASGSITADGALYAKFQDVAEWVPATTNLEPGTVVVLNPESTNEVMASRSSYDTSVAGVVSAQPGLSLGVPGPGMEQIATTGRVKVRIDSRSAPIKVGDLLVTSDILGTAMRSEPMNLNGRKFHQPGTIIGKALEPHSGGEGEILVLLSLQ